MNFEEALQVELNSIPQIADKIFPLAATEGVKTPYLVYVSSEGVQEKYLDGYEGAKEVECELHILNDSYSGLKDITRQVIDKVKTFQQNVIGINGDTWDNVYTGGVWVQNITYERSVEQYIPELLQYLCILSLNIRIFEDPSNPSQWSNIDDETWEKI
jgi:hypothetical protein